MNTDEVCYMELLWFRQKKSDEMIADYSKMNENVRSTNMLYNNGIITNSIQDDYRGERRSQYIFDDANLEL